ncbi:hypothetical protein [Morganella psychrotolerans]|uniref:hypothetical protein n=1 Tax=Morganella psychrotolerans TaxID=368603 RepID=UPI00138FAC6B|nr:hypothetical protein [Morganella psychrotolerans]
MASLLVLKRYTPHYDGLDLQLCDADVTEHYLKAYYPAVVMVPEGGVASPVIPLSARDAVLISAAKTEVYPAPDCSEQISADEYKAS